ncbi:MAG: glycosyltransferase family 2 protein [Betaproteobacteria bacterium HGW-Betaproteobacteria-5]|nr:MAG: glycosyltransferase family 2 protein [Betaproteobacteria bacterium HGW-Betaproteobacteria-5]
MTLDCAIPGMSGSDKSDIGVWIVVLNWKNGPDTLECLESIISSNDPCVAGVVVCDNASGDGSDVLIRNWFSNSGFCFSEAKWSDGEFLSVGAGNCEATDSSIEFALVHTGANLGFAGGNNVGIRYVQHSKAFDYLFLLNNDALLAPGAVSGMVGRFAEGEQTGMCGCTVIYHHTPSQVQAYGGASFAPWLGRAVHIGAHLPVSAPRDAAGVEARLDYILGAALMISRPCLEQIGLMEESYFLYFEEVDWATRAARAGFSFGYAPDAVVYHKEGGTIGSSSKKGARSLLSEHYLVRSRLRFTQKFYPWHLPGVIVFTIVQGARAVVGGDVSRFLVRMRAMFGLPFKA